MSTTPAISGQLLEALHEPLEEARRRRPSKIEREAAMRGIEKSIGDLGRVGANIRRAVDGGRFDDAFAASEAAIRSVEGIVSALGVVAGVNSAKVANTIARAADAVDDLQTAVLLSR